MAGEATDGAAGTRPVVGWFPACSVAVTRRLPRDALCSSTHAGSGRRIAGGATPVERSDGIVGGTTSDVTA